MQYDELTRYMFAKIIQAGAISSHVHDFPDTFCARYYGSLVLPSPQYYELLMKKEVTRTKVHLRAAMKYCTLSCNCTKLVNSEHHAASGSIVCTGCHPVCSSYSPNLKGICADSSSLTGSTLY